MPVATTAVTAFLALSKGAISSPPKLENSWCADITEALTVDGVKDPISTNSYNLCVDAENMRWSQAQKPEGSHYSIFNGTDLWTLFPDSSLPGGYNCTHKYSGPEPSTDMPYRMSTIDTNADLNKTETYDGIKNAQNWYAYRPGSKPGARIQFAAQQMHWHITPGANPYLLASECIEVSQMENYKGKLQHGTRDFSANRTKFIERQLPAGVKCTEAPVGPHEIRSDFTSLLKTELQAIARR